MWSSQAHFSEEVEPPGWLLASGHQPEAWADRTVTAAASVWAPQPFPGLAQVRKGFLSPVFQLSIVIIVSPHVTTVHLHSFASEKQRKARSPWPWDEGQQVSPADIRDHQVFCREGNARRIITSHPIQRRLSARPGRATSLIRAGGFYLPLQWSRWTNCRILELTSLLVSLRLARLFKRWARWMWQEQSDRITCQGWPVSQSGLPQKRPWGKDCVRDNSSRKDSRNRKMGASEKGKGNNKCFYCWRQLGLNPNRLFWV